MPAAARRPSLRTHLHALDTWVQRQITRRLRPHWHQGARQLQQALRQPGLGAVAARLAALRPAWHDAQAALLTDVLTHAVDAARRAFLAMLRQRYGAARTRRLWAGTTRDAGTQPDAATRRQGKTSEFPPISASPRPRVAASSEADEDENDLEEVEDETDLDDLEAPRRVALGVLTALLFRPDATGLSLDDRVRRNEARAATELLAALHLAQRRAAPLDQALAVLRTLAPDDPRWRAVLTQVERAGRQALAAAPAARDRLLALVRQERQEGDARTRGRGDAARDMTRQAAAGEEAVLDDVVETHVERRAARRAEVLLRTAAAQAYTRTLLAEYRASGVVPQVRFVLSNLHRHEDMCDDLVGVYALRDAPPCPAHPRCLCSLEPIFDVRSD